MVGRVLGGCVGGVVRYWVGVLFVGIQRRRLIVFGVLVIRLGRGGFVWRGSSRLF